MSTEISVSGPRSQCWNSGFYGTVGFCLNSIHHMPMTWKYSWNRTFAQTKENRELCHYYVHADKEI